MGWPLTLVAALLPLDRAPVLVDLAVGHVVEGVARVRRAVDGRVVLVAALDDALGGGAHQHLEGCAETVLESRIVVYFHVFMKQTADGSGL